MPSTPTNYTIAYRSHNSVYQKGPVTAENLVIQSDEDPLDNHVKELKDNIRAMSYSPNGEFLAILTNEKVMVLNVECFDIIYQYTQKSILELSFSPNGSFLSTWERQLPPDPNTKAIHQNLVIHHLPSQSIFYKSAQKSQVEWMPQWTQDERFFGLLPSPGQVHFFSTSDPAKVANTLIAENLRGFSLSGGPHPHVAVFFPEGKKKGLPAMVKLFSLKNLNMPLSSKTFFRTDSVKFLWNRLGTGVLVLASTDVDATGQSYYGQSSLYYISTMGNFDCRVPLEGPVHDISWAPNSKDFAVTYGFMPSKTVLFSHRASPIFDFGTNSRNTLSFSPNGRVLCIGGFGNLPGELDFWDLTSMKKLVTVSCPNSTYLEWSPDGRFLMTATLSPRLRVDNGWKIWHYHGACIAHSQVPVLLQIGWRPSLNAVDLEFWKARELSPAPVSVISVAPVNSAGVYVPPSARRQNLNSLITPSHNATAAIPAVVGATMIYSALKPRGQPHSESDGASKRIADLKKKLKQIQALKKKRESGESVDKAQLLKIEREPAIRHELSELTQSTHHHK